MSAFLYGDGDVISLAAGNALAGRFGRIGWLD
jgi:hypothetical protein